MIFRSSKRVAVKGSNTPTANSSCRDGKMKILYNLIGLVLDGLYCSHAEGFNFVSREIRA